jgi:hypothetical protein
MAAFSVYAENEPTGQSLRIAEPFIELHTGPGEAYPVFHVIDRGQQIEVLGARAGWFQVRDNNGVEGWVDRDQLQRTLTPGGDRLQLQQLGLDDFEQRRWELTVMTGELEGAPLLSLAGTYALTRNLSAEATFAHSIGNVSSSTLLKTNLLMQPIPEWTYAPFFTLGIGRLQVKPSATLVDPEDRQNNFTQIGLGIKRFLSRRFVLRFEVNQYVVFSANNDRDDNEEIGEWKLGFAVYY